jgi:hypothetical protein
MGDSMSTIINATTTNGVVIQPDNSGSLVLQTNSGTTAVTIDKSQNVGIGTTSPASGLELFRSGGQTTAAITTGTNVEPFITLRQNSASAGAGGGAIFGAQGGSFAAVKGLLTDGNSNTVGDLAFSTRNAAADSALTERMRITSAGNVGIGTTSPARKLAVNGTIATKSISGSMNAALSVITGGATVSIGLAGLILVEGAIAGNNFWDLILMQSFGGINVISSATFGSPSTRTYSQTGGGLTIALSGGTSGTYSVNYIQISGS